MGLFDKTSLYKENYKDDLKRVYDEMYNKVRQWRDSLGISEDDILQDDDFPEAIKETFREFFLFLRKFPELAGTSAVIIYICLIHTILFTDEYRMGE